MLLGLAGHRKKFRFYSEAESNPGVLSYKHDLTQAVESGVACVCWRVDNTAAGGADSMLRT